MIEDESQSLIFEQNGKKINIEFSQTIKYKTEKGKFCLKKLYSKIDLISFSFTVYIPDTNDAFSFTDSQYFNRNKSFLGLLYNGYFYKKIIKESEIKNSYYPSDYNASILYFYLYVIRGIVEVSNYITNNFPFNNENNNEEVFKLININNIGNEYFGTILIKNEKELNSSPMDANKNIFLVNCRSGVIFNDELTNFCEYNIMFYSENDLIRLRINEKFSYLNYDKIKLKMKIGHNLENNKLVIDLYNYYGFSNLNILNIDKDSSLNTFYNGHLITNEIVFNNNKNNGYLGIIYYDLEVISYDYDYVSISLNENNNENKNLLETRFWFNDYILSTLTKRIPNKKIIIDHIPRVVTDLNYFKLIIIFKFLNCQINSNILDNQGQENNLTSSFQKTVDNNNLIVLEGIDFSKSRNTIEFQMDLIKAYNNDPVCMIYLSTFLKDDMSYTTLYPILIRENIDTPIILTSKYNYLMSLEYIILNYNSPIIISISFEEMTEIYLSYRINNNEAKDIELQFSQYIIIYENEIKNKCNKDKENKLCKLNIDIGRTTQSIIDNPLYSKNVLLNINIKSNYENVVSYLNSNSLIDGIILGDQFQYYYTNIRQNDCGVIILNNKKGLGLMYARIINKNTIDKNETNGQKWNGRIHLLNKEEIKNCNDCFIYDINTNEIRISEKDTKDCISDLRCQIIIGISNIENKNEDNINENDIYEYSIYFLKNNIQNQISGNVKIQSNKYIQGNLINEKNYNKIVYDYYINENVEIIKYELQCDSCSLFLITNNSRIKQDNNNKNIEKYSSKIINFENENGIHFYYDKIVSFEISINIKEKEKFNNNIYYFKISLIYKGMNENILLLKSEMNSICYKECFYLIPIYNYDKLTSLILSLSDINLKAKINVKLDFSIYDSIKNYSNIMMKNNSDKENGLNTAPNSNKIISNKNYIIYEERDKYKNMIILGHIQIFNNEEFKSFQVYFTYSKNSRKNYFLYPNRNNLLYINKNSESQHIKEIRIPDFYLIDNSNNKYEDNKKDSSIISFSHIKGEGIVELITNNYYLHNNINKLYSEFKSFFFDTYHSFFQINYNKKSKFSKKFFINSEEGIYAYAKIMTNLYPNTNEIKLGKTNYILHQNDSSPVYLYIIINDIDEIENDIT